MSESGAPGGGYDQQKKWEDYTPEEREAFTKWWQNYAYLSAMSAAAAQRQGVPTAASVPERPVVPSPSVPAAAAAAATRKVTTGSSSRTLQPAAAASADPKVPSTGKHSKYVMAAAGITWVDPSLDEWPESLSLFFFSLSLIIKHVLSSHVSMCVQQMTLDCSLGTLGMIVLMKC